MLRYMLRLLGADYEQWRALTRIAIKLDVRVASLVQTARRGSGTPKSTAGLLIARFWFYLFFGIFLGVLAARNKDVFFTGTILVAYTMVVLAMVVLVDFGAVVISPDDFAILGYQPVSSQTYFISRLTNILIYTTLLSLTLGIIPAIVYFFTLGFKPLLGIAALLALLLGGISATLFLVYIYAGMLRVIHPGKLRRVVGYIQLAMSFFIGFSYLFLTDTLYAKRLGSIALPKQTWFLLLPPTWFASYLELALGNWRPAELFSAILSLTALGLLFAGARGKLALGYADRLSSAMATGEEAKKVSAPNHRQSWLFGKNESRAVALLMRNQFKYDQKFRLAVLGILPLSALYLFMGLRSGPLIDPFVIRHIMPGNSWMLYVAVMMFPVMLNANLANSDAYLASWIYYATPADRGRLVLASKRYVFACFVIPYLAFLGALFLYFWRNPGHVIAHLGVLGLISHLFLQIAVLFRPVLPFSLPLRKAERSASMVVTMMFVPFAGIGLLAVLFYWAYPKPLVLAEAVAGIAAISYLLEIRLKKRVQRHTAFMEYQG
jgi:hypothetical protein